MRLSILNLIFSGIITAVFVVFIFARWQSKNEKIKILNNEILITQTKINSLEEQGNRALTYVRIHRGLDVMAGRRLSNAQKNILTERLFDISVDYKIDPILILAVIKHESRGDPNARGAFFSGAESGALGLMQIKYGSALEVARSVGVRLHSSEDLFDPEINLMVGTAYLLRLIAKYQNLQHALIAYNVGLGTLDGKLKSGAALPTRYYNRVMQEYQFLVERIFE
ncbi:MAG: transglycosylase SLT domain-containing protein [Fibromonadaceae bacterium]|jgi:soluble lytic murein transglycosylase|nr:transglycosylase SLT domain-containing protein [Fibromonadaceae bacterium]